MSLKSLAMAVLSRDAQRDVGGTEAVNPVETGGTEVGRPGGTARSASEAWGETLARLDLTGCPPAFAIVPARWRSGVIQARRLVATGWAGQLLELGWTETDLFGCSASTPAQRHDLSGLAMHMQDLDVRCADNRRVVLVGRHSRFSFERINSTEPRLPLWAYATEHLS